MTKAKENAIAMKTKSALSYFGSDSEVAGELAAMLNHCKHVTIPFCGGLSILPHLKARAIVANDLHRQALNFYRVVVGRYGNASRDWLIQQCQATLSHPAELQQANQASVGTFEWDAWSFWAQCWIGRKGKGGTKSMGGMPSVRRTANGGTNASRIREAANDLEEWSRLFERCEFESVCFRDLLPKVADREDCGIYLDPPWVGAGRDYLHQFTEQDHRDLVTLLQRFERTAIVLRYGDDPLIRELYSDWDITEASSRTQANKTTSEIWITKRKRTT